MSLELELYFARCASKRVVPGRGFTEAVVVDVVLVAALRPNDRG
jgi:hypothetical protein